MPLILGLQRVGLFAQLRGIRDSPSVSLLLARLRVTLVPPVPAAHNSQGSAAEWGSDSTTKGGQENNDRNHEKGGPSHSGGDRHDVDAQGTAAMVTG